MSWSKKLFLAFMVFVFLAVALRVSIATNRNIEVRYDTLLYQVWGWNAFENGITNVYEKPFYPAEIYQEARGLRITETWRGVNYLPPYLYLLWGTDGLRRILAPTSGLGTETASLFQKIPGMFFDVATALLLALIVRKHHGERWGLVVGLIYLFHPAVVYLSSGWGQSDTTYTFFLVLAIWLLEKGRLLSATAALTISFFFKMQAVALAPLFFYELVRTKSPKTILGATSVALGTAILITLPYLATGKILEILRVIFEVAGSYPRLSMYAMNFWWLMAGGYGEVTSDETFVYGMPLALIGFMLYTAVVALVLWIYAKKISIHSRWLTASLLIFAFFLFPTEMHERYLFPFFALLLPVLPKTNAMRYAYLIVSLTYSLAILYVLFAPWLGHNARPWTILLAVTNIAAFIVMMMIFWRTQNKQRFTPLQ